MLFILLFQGEVSTWSAPHCCAGLQQPRLQGVPHCRGDGLGCPRVVAVGALQAVSALTLEVPGLLGPIWGCSLGSLVWSAVPGASFSSTDSQPFL